MAYGRYFPCIFCDRGKQRARLDQIAAVFGTNLSAVINKALDQYIDLHEWPLKHIQEGVEEAKRGDFATDEEVDTFFSEHGQPS